MKIRHGETKSMARRKLMDQSPTIAGTLDRILNGVRTERVPESQYTMISQGSAKRTVSVTTNAVGEPGAGRTT